MIQLLSAFLFLYSIFNIKKSFTLYKNQNKTLNSIQFDFLQLHYLMLISSLLFFFKGYFYLDDLIFFILIFMILIIIINSIINDNKEITSLPPLTRALLSIFKKIIPILIVMFIFTSFVFQSFFVPTGSMYPNIIPKDLIVVEKYKYGITMPIFKQKLFEILPERGDVIVFSSPKKRSEQYIKRLIGLPGDKIVYKNKQIFVNNFPFSQQRLSSNTEKIGNLTRNYKIFEEKYINKSYKIAIVSSEPLLYINAIKFTKYRNNCKYTEDILECIVPKEHFFVMGDNRDDSEDSRYIGFIDKDFLIGRASYIWMNFNNFDRIGLPLN